MTDPVPLLSEDALLESSPSLTSAQAHVEGEVSDELTDCLIGTTLQDTYLVERVLGEGGMGRIYEARHTRLRKKRYAIKVLHAELAMNSDLQARFHREAETAASIDHPNVMGTYDVGRTPQGWQYIVCEHLQGVDLHDQLERWGPLQVVTQLHIGRRVCEAVEAAHERGVIHRDLKPHNVFLVGDYSQGLPARPHVKVLDFGLSRFVDTESELTKTGMIMGTPGYMAPEQANSATTDERTDVYGVGAILYAMATGQAPFAEDTPQQTILAVMTREPERPSSVCSQVSEELEQVIQRAMAKDPAHRYRTVSELRAALARLETDPAPSMLPPRSTASPEVGAESEPNARLRLLGLLLVLFVASLFVGMNAAVAAAHWGGPPRAVTGTEAALAAALILTLLFPLALGLRQFRRNVWSNTARVVDWLKPTRAALWGALSAYGAVALGIAARREALWLAPPPLSVFATPHGYFANSLALAGVAVLGAGLGIAHHRWPRLSTQTRWFVRSAAVLASAGALGLLWAANRHPSAPLEPRHSVSSVSAADLEEAVQRGPDALRLLAATHPSDPAPLEALVRAYTTQGGARVEALHAMQRLLALDPESLARSDLQHLVEQACQAGGVQAQICFSILEASHAQGTGELVYRILETQPQHRLRALALLDAVCARGACSAALAIARDLHTAPDCYAQHALLQRATAVGDQRVGRLVQQLANENTRHPECHSFSTAFRQAARALSHSQ